MELPPSEAYWDSGRIAPALRGGHPGPGELEGLLSEADEDVVALGAAEHESALEAGHGLRRVAPVEPALAEVLEDEIGVGGKIRGRAALEGVAEEGLRPVQVADVAGGFGEADQVGQLARLVGGGTGEGGRVVFPRAGVRERAGREVDGALDGGRVDRHLPQVGVVPRRRVEVDQALRERSAHRGFR